MSKQTKEAKEAKHFDVDVKVRDFCSKSKVFFIIGLALILISLLSTFTGVNVALEFKGGTIITYSYVGDVDENSISKELTSLVGSAVKVQQGDSLDSDTKTLSLSFTSNDGLTIDRQNDVTNKVKELCPDNDVTLLDANDVNARSGGEFFAKCIVAAVFAALLLIIYIAFRFKQISGWSAGVCAVLGLLSTLIVTYGCVVLCRFEIDSNFMAVILTLLGYAVNDTIVIYDRIRENRVLLKGMSYREIVNLSLNQTLARTILTSLTVVLVLVMQLCFGGASIRDFVFVMLVGVVVGTFSTIFVSTIIVAYWHKDKEPSTGSGPEKKAETKTIAA